MTVGNAIIKLSKDFMGILSKIEFDLSLFSKNKTVDAFNITHLVVFARSNTMIVCASYLLEDSLTAKSILSSFDLQTEKLLTFIDSSDVISFVIAGKEYL